MSASDELKVAGEETKEVETAKESSEGGGESGETGSEGAMTLLQHLEELRKAMVRSVIALVIGFGACYGFSEQMFQMLMQPMEDVLKQGSFIYTYPPEAFFAHIKVGLVAGFFLASPYIFWQIWKFVAPGLYQHERKWLIPIAICSAIFFVTGALFGYFAVFPYGFEFFASYSTEQIQFMPKLSEYLGFALKLLFAFGIVFELPLVIFFLSRLGLVTSKGLRKKRKYALLFSFVVAALLTPPDPFTQSLMAGPLVLLYEMGIWVAYFFGKEKKAPAEGQEDGEKDEKDKAPESGEA